MLAGRWQLPKHVAFKINIVQSHQLLYENLLCYTEENYSIVSTIHSGMETHRVNV
jgi:hypothetical protein